MIDSVISNPVRSDGAAHPAGTRRPRVASKARVGRIILNVFGGCGVLLFLAPMALTVLTALRTSSDVAKKPLGIPEHWTLGNLAAVFRQMDYLRTVTNTLIVTGISTLIVVVLGALAAYPLARITARWTRWMYRLFLAGLSIPLFVGIAPLYLALRDLHLINTRSGVILIYAGINLPLAVFFYTSFIRSVPLELEEAAAIDGCGAIRTFGVVVLPLLRPVTATLTMFLTLSVWNDLIVPLVFLQDPKQWTVMVDAYAFVGPHGYDPTILFAASLLGTLPLLLMFVLLQRSITQGIVAGAVKG